MIALHDVVDGGVAVGVQLLVGDANTALVGQARRGVGQQQLQDVVAISPARLIGRNTPTRATLEVSRCRIPSAIVDFPVLPSGAAI